MKIDRSAFLLLAGAIATTTACIIVKDPPPGTAQNATGTPTATTAPATTAPTPNPNTTAPKAYGGGVFGAFHHGANGGNGGTTDNGGGGTTADAGGGTTTTCLDDGAQSPPACAPAAGSPCTEGVGDACDTFTSSLEPKVAAAAITCLNALAKDAQCDSAQRLACATTALKTACPTKSQNAQTGCQGAAQIASCNVTANDCMTELGGLTDDALNSMETCSMEGASGNPPQPCAQNDFQGCLGKVLNGDGSSTPSAAAGIHPHPTPPRPPTPTPHPPVPPTHR